MLTTTLSYNHNVKAITAHGKQDLECEEALQSTQAAAAADH